MFYTINAKSGIDTTEYRYVPIMNFKRSVILFSGKNVLILLRALSIFIPQKLTLSICRNFSMSRIGLLSLRIIGKLSNKAITLVYLGMNGMLDVFT